MKDFKEMIALAREKGPKTISVACAQDKEVLIAVENARKEGIANAILVGDAQKIEEIAKAEGIDLSNYEIVDEKDLAAASLKAVEFVSSGKAHVVMKGLVDTSIILKAVLNKEVGLRTGNVLSHVALFAIPGYDRMFFVTDAAMNIAPDVKTKKQIIENAVSVAHSIGVNEPKVAVICAKEKVNDKMPATVEAKELEDMYKAGEFEGCMVGGPFALDNAVSEEAAKHKGMDHPMAGKADILLVPDIEAGNVLYKSMVFFARSENAGLIVGAKAPVVLTSRADSDVTKLNSIALGVLAASK
ncbi:phosphate butyryltransferase [Peptoclostridium litorale DSM 5388]|uniref:Phosphate butyryltransferase Ptb n=1 Tax=Peptoclostridium litorale DSM 5388 TaxID=1121324 RepID=A0A069RJP2_PEPLI|nr:phosphate butyryltransferase [Peptoclostridium litorale]KDR94462.1 phosphate butyryltransferase Ptb [Peptoclostridium litorale DSM 5388]SIO36951.1 phosphate butyryltransferase [Peptoclostridium litorale DSM 5388]